YDVRVGGGLAAQNPQPSFACEGPDACRPGVTPPPPSVPPLTPNVQGSGNVRERTCRKGTVKRGGRCVKPRRKHRKHTHHKK
ncbi:MAG TPA: hypothetical protein VFJ57_06060, partial [Solirubrobacterales bacterium]|nr:hypothetical protein [Solirubrobacterales bacterium]